MGTSKKLFRTSALTLVLFLAVVVSAGAVASGPADADMFTNYNDQETAFGQTTPNDLWITKTGDPGGNCVDSRITYLQWSLTDVPEGGIIGYVGVTLTRSGATSNGPGYTIGLYQASDEWTEASTYATTPLPGALLDTKPFLTTNGASLTFSSDALLSYVQAQADGDNVLSLAVKLVTPGTCPTSAVSLVFDSSEDSAGVAPSLDVRTAPPPNAVSVATSSAETVTWPLYAGLGAVALVVIAGLAVSRRRTA